MDSLIHLSVDGQQYDEEKCMSKPIISTLTSQVYVYGMSVYVYVCAHSNVNGCKVIVQHV